MGDKMVDGLTDYGDYQEWCLNGKLHRIDGPAVIRIDGAKWWYQYGTLHRVGGPAAEHSDGTKYWLINGKFHREDGPACEFADGNKYWYLNDEQVFCKNNEEFLRIIKLKAFW